MTIKCLFTLALWTAHIQSYIKDIVMAWHVCTPIDLMFFRDRRCTWSTISVIIRKRRRRRRTKINLLITVSFSFKRIPLIKIVKVFTFFLRNRIRRERNKNQMKLQWTNKFSIRNLKEKSKKNKKTLTLRPIPEKQHHVALLANLVDNIIEPVPGYHGLMLFQTLAFVAVQIHQDAVSSMNFVY